MNTKYIFNRYFNGEKNFITPKVYNYGYIQFGDKTLLYEKSKGKGLYDHTIYGLTFLVIDNETNEVQRIDLSKPFNSSKELNKYLKSISKEEFENAEVYGEIKIINS